MLSSTARISKAVGLNCYYSAVSVTITNFTPVSIAGSSRDNCWGRRSEGDDMWSSWEKKCQSASPWKPQSWAYTKVWEIFLINQQKVINTCIYVWAYVSLYEWYDQIFYSCIDIVPNGLLYLAFRWEFRSCSQSCMLSSVFISHSSANALWLFADVVPLFTQLVNRANSKMPLVPVKRAQWINLLIG